MLRVHTIGPEIPYQSGTCHTHTQATQFPHVKFTDCN